MATITLVVHVDDEGNLTTEEPVVTGARRPLIGGCNVQFTAGDDGSLSAVAEGALRELEAGDVVGEEEVETDSLADATDDDPTPKGDRD